MVPQQLPPRLERLELALEFRHAYYAVDKFDVDFRRCEQVFVLSLWVFREQTNGRGGGRGEGRVRKLTTARSALAQLPG